MGFGLLFSCVFLCVLGLYWLVFSLGGFGFVLPVVGFWFGGFVCIFVVILLFFLFGWLAVEFVFLLFCGIHSGLLGLYMFECLVYGCVLSVGFGGSVCLGCLVCVVGGFVFLFVFCCLGFMFVCWVSCLLWVCCFGVWFAGFGLVCLGSGFFWVGSVVCCVYSVLGSVVYLLFGLWVLGWVICVCCFLV